MDFQPFSRSYNKSGVEISFVNLTILSYLFRMSIPILKYPFLLFYIFLIVYSLINYSKSLYPTLKGFIRNYYLLLILTIILIISFIYSNKIYLTIFKDVVNATILISLLYLMTLVISRKENLKTYLSNLLYLIIIFGSIISILGLLDLLDIFSCNPNTFTAINVETKIDALEVDQNFALLPGFFAFLGILFLLLKCNSKLQSVFFNVLLVIISINIFLSGSRRGLILIIFIIIILLIIKFIKLFWNRGIIKDFYLKYNLFLFLTFILLILLNLFLFHSSTDFKTNTLNFLGSKNVVTAKFKLLLNLYRYNSVIDKQTSFSDLGWTIMYDPNDPDSGWGSRIHNTVFPLVGENVNIVPFESKGYLMDSTCNGSYYSGIDLCESYTLMVNLNVKKGDHINAYVYCFVSDSFDINSASIGVRYNIIDEKIVFGNATSTYDLQNAGRWQKLELDFDCNEANIPIYLSFWKKGVKDFSNLKGHIIFAYPKYKKINGSVDGSSQVVTLNNSNSDKFKIFDFAKDTQNRKAHKLFHELNYKSTENTVYITDFHSIPKRDNLTLMPKTFTARNYLSFNIFYLPFSTLIASGKIHNDLDPIRNLVSKFISEDTTYYPYKSQFFINSVSNQLTDSRLIRWQYAVQIFTKEYSIKKKLFGGGFNFLNWYGYYFLKDKTASDWPHNPFLSILLYSGIFGLLIYCFFLYKVFYYYIKYIKEYPLLFIFFLITFFFSFFSGGSPFDPPIMGFFSILPFFIHAVHKKDKLEAGNQESEVVIKQ